MNELFLKIINMSISASWLILAVLILRLVLRKAPKWVNVLLWGIVAIRLICPFSIESALSLIPSAETIPLDIGMDTTPTINSGINAINNAVNPIISQSNTPMAGASVNPLQITIGIYEYIWIFGMIALALYTAISYWRLRRKVDTAVRCKDNIFQSENVSSPFVLGIIKPRIYLPFKLDGQNLEHVVAHEQAHIRRKDHWWKPLGFLLLTIHWFNPLMWLAYVLLCRDIELACDEKVIKELGNEQRADYTQALVACSVNRRMIAACPLAFGEVGVKERVKSVMNYKKSAFWIVILAVIACMGVAVCFLTNPKQDSYTLRIVVPAGSQEEFVYSDEEVSTIKNSIKIWSGDGLGDTEVLLYPVNKTTETGYTATYLTHGMPVEFDAEKDTWFKIGVNMQNPTDEDIFVYVEVENVEVRIATSAAGVIEWFDYTNIPEEMDWDNEITIEIPEIPDITFCYTPEKIIAAKKYSDADMTGHTMLITGMPIWNAYFYDCTGDGVPEICSSLSMGSGMIDNRIIIFDYVNGTSYGLNDRGNYDYYLRLNKNDGYLYVDKKIYHSNEIVSSGRLIFSNGCITVEYANEILMDANIPLHKEYEPIGVSSDNVKEISNIPNNIEFQGGLSFSELAPGKEIISSDAVTIEEDSSVMLIITWGAQDLFLEYGIRNEDGTELFQEKRGGSSCLLIENIPAGTYYFYVKNSDAYDGIPAYENPSEFAGVSFNATGAMNYAINPD